MTKGDLPPCATGAEGGQPRHLAWGRKGRYTRNPRRSANWSRVLTVRVGTHLSRQKPSSRCVVVV
jgi:hypothetical protein